MASKRVRVVISGRVQGVGFRWFTREQALERGLTGFVRNLPDGRVEAEFEGDPDAVDDMVEWSRGGPSYANVSRVQVTDRDPTGEDGFRITRA